MHRNPELGFDLPRTAAFVAGKLREFGVDELHEGIAQTGMVAIVNGQGDGPDCHHPVYDLNDGIAPIGASFFARLVECAQPLG